MVTITDATSLKAKVAEARAVFVYAPSLDEYVKVAKSVFLALIDRIDWEKQDARYYPATAALYFG